MIEVDGLTKRYGAKAAVATCPGFLGPNGAGVLIRHSIATTVTAIVTLVMLPIFLSTQHRLTAEIHHATVFSAWQRLTEAYGPPQVEAANVQAGQLIPGLYPSLSEAWISYAVWPLVALLLAVLVVRRRDV